MMRRGQGGVLATGLALIAVIVILWLLIFVILPPLNKATHQYSATTTSTTATTTSTPTVYALTPTDVLAIESSTVAIIFVAVALGFVIAWLIRDRG